MPKARPDRPWTQEMVIVHRAMRAAFHQAPTLIRCCPDSRVDLVFRHVSGLLNGLHHHHTAEDELLWPRLRARVPASALRRIQDGEDQHAGLDPLIADTTEHLDTWRRRPGRTAAEGLASSLSRLADALDQHLDFEETELLPLAAAHLTAGEWSGLARRAARGLPKARLLVALSDLAAACGPEEEARFLRRVPLPVRAVWRAAGPRAHARYYARLQAA